MFGEAMVVATPRRAISRSSDLLEQPGSTNRTGTRSASDRASSCPTLSTGSNRQRVLERASVGLSPELGIMRA